MVPVCAPRQAQTRGRLARGYKGWPMDSAARYCGRDPARQPGLTYT